MVKLVVTMLVVGGWLNLTGDSVCGDYVHLMVRWVGGWMRGWVIHLVGRLIIVLLVMSRLACWEGMFI